MYRHLRICKCRSALVDGREWRSLTYFWWYIAYLRLSYAVYVIVGLSTWTRLCLALRMVISCFGFDNDFPNWESSSTAGGLRADILVQYST